MTGKTLNILFIEDGPLDSKLIKEYLDEEGTHRYRLTSAVSLKIGMDKLEEEKFDIILLSVNLNDITGVKTFDTLYSAFHIIPIVILTGVDDEQLATDAIKNGAQDYLLISHLTPHLLVRAILYSIERKKTRDKISESEARFKVLWENTKMGVVVIDSETNTIVQVNPTALAIIDAAEENLLGRNYEELFCLTEKGEPPIFDLNQEVDDSEGILLKANGASISILISVKNVIINGRKHLIESFVDVSERKEAEGKIVLTSRILSILNRQNEWKKLIKDILIEIKTFTQFEAVAIRLKEGEDFPYFESEGFPSDFLKKEKFLVARDEKGEIIRDSEGKAVIECLCGNIISGSYNSSKVVFTEGGSFWTNGTTELLAAASEDERQGSTKNRCNNHCNKSGYESVALIPLKSGDEVIGLLQFNDKRKNTFKKELIEYFEGIGTTIGIAYKRMINERSIIKSEEQFRSLYENSTIGIICTDLKGTILIANPAFLSMLGYRSLDELKLNLHKIYKEPDLVSDFYRIVRSEGVIYDYQSVMKKNDGSEIIVQESGRLVDEGNDKNYYGTVINITESKRAEESLIQNAERLNTLLNIYEFNASGVQEFLDYALNEAIKLTSSKIGYIFFYDEENKEFILNSWSNDVMEFFKAVDPESCSELDKTGIWGEAVRQRKEILVNNFSQSNFAKKEHPDGQFEISRFLTIPIFDKKRIVAVVGMANKKEDYDDTDIKQLKLLMNSVWRIVKRKEADGQNLKLSMAVKQNPVSVVITDIYSNIEYVNPKFSKLTGYSFAEAFGKNMNILNSGHHPEEFYKDLYATILSGNEFKCEMLNKKKNGELFWESASISPIVDSNDKITHFVALKEDITEKKKMLEDLIAAKNEAEEMNKLKTYFFANMSHELRTPFVGIQGFAEILSDTLTDPEEKQMAGFILDSSKRLTDTLDKILSLTKLEFAKMEVVKTDIDINALLLECHKLYFNAALQKKLSFVLKDLDEPVIINSDEGMLKGILVNLISNAIKYTNEGEVIIKSSIIKREGDEKLLISIKDTGIGIPKKNQEQIWLAFRQVSEGLDRSYEGTGLGLAIVNKYSELIGCKVTLESEENKGCCFTIELPISRQDMQAALAGEPSGAIDKKVKEIEKYTRKILYTEDDKFSREIVSKILSKQYEIETVVDSASSLEKVKNEIYDALIIDINLGRGMNGIELMTAIRELPEYENTPMIALTAYASPLDKDEFLASGFTHYLSKPFDSKNLRDLMENVFKGVDNQRN